MAGESALVRIVAINDKVPAKAKVVTKQLPTEFNGDVTVSSDQSSTDVIIRLANHLINGNGDRYAFNDPPAAVAWDGPPIPNEPDPSTFGIKRISNAVAQITVPAISDKKTSYKYTLFLTRNSDKQVITIDPKIKNGGGSNFFDYILSRSRSSLALFAISAGFITGWLLKR